MNLAPVVLFVYNRPTHTQRTLSALRANSLAGQTDLIVFSDAAKNGGHESLVREVRRICQEEKGFASIKIVERAENFGLSKSIRSGVSEILEKKGRAIVLEDDLATAPLFLEFMNRSLDRYAEDPKIFSISGWAPDIAIPDSYKDSVYLSRRALCWGWGTWLDRWQKMDWQVRDYASFAKDSEAKRRFELGGEDLTVLLRSSVVGGDDSWAVRWCYNQFRQDLFAVVPRQSYVENLGQDDSGTHTKAEYRLAAAPMQSAAALPEFPEVLELNAEIAQRFREFYGYNWRGKIKKFLGLL